MIDFPAQKMQDAGPSLARVDSRQLFAAWAILCAVVGALVLLYLAVGWQASGPAAEAPVMPLDDTYIHFQYARAIADGYPFRYNPDQPPTSGATSLLYPAILAVGYRLGFQGERLAWWALLIGVLCWIGSVWLVYRIGANDGSRAAHGVGLVMALAFALTGSLGWAFMSGMETGLMLLATLLTLWYVVRDDRRGAIFGGVLIALIRPEGLVIGLLAAITMTSRESSRRALIHRLPLYSLPLIAGLIQPVLNALATGSVAASGMQAKSYLYNVPPDLGALIKTTADVAARIWSELIGGFGEKGIPYVLPGLVLLCVPIVIVSLRDVWRMRRLSPVILIVGWLLGLTAAISILETAFWQFSRYQQPMIALLFPLAAWSLIALGRALNRAYRLVVTGAALIVLAGFSLATTFRFAGYYADNVREVASSQVPMARYVTEHVPPGAIVGVHDIGVMRYLGSHATYDVVGLTTPGAAQVWRSGPGAVYEQMLNSPWRPGYFAIYRDARGLTYLAETDLFKETLARFSSTQPPVNVASATDSGQAVYKAGWTFAAFAGQPWQPSSLSASAGMKRVHSVNVADFASEDSHQYRWWEAVRRSGFATEVREMDYAACQPTPANPSCKLIDGGRLITGGEEMTITTEPGQDLIWITRVHPYNAAALTISVNGRPVARRVIPAIPGQWLEIVTLVPGSLITGTQTLVRAEANITDPAAGHYMPYYHWFYQGTYHADTTITLPGPTARFGQAIILAGRSLAYNASTRTLKVDLEWQVDPGGDAGSLGDAKTFVHLYDQNDQFVKDVQVDQRPGDGVLPPANWLPGVVRDTLTLVVPESVPPGTYRVTIGLYDPVTMVRLPVTGEGLGSDRRLFIGNVGVR